MANISICITFKTNDMKTIKVILQTKGSYSKFNFQTFEVELNKVSRNYVEIQGLNSDFPDSYVAFSLNEVLVVDLYETLKEFEGQGHTSGNLNVNNFLVNWSIEHNINPNGFLNKPGEGYLYQLQHKIKF